jgi:hypothetical protein
VDSFSISKYAAAIEASSEKLLEFDLDQRMKTWKMSPIEPHRLRSSSNNSTDDMVYTDP